MESNHQPSQSAQEKRMWCFEDHRRNPQKIRLWNVGKGVQADQPYQLHGKPKELWIYSQDQVLINPATLFRVWCSRFHRVKDNLAELEITWSVQKSEDDQKNQWRTHACATWASSRLLKISFRKVSHKRSTFASLVNPAHCIRKRQAHPRPDQQTHEFSS